MAAYCEAIIDTRKLEEKTAPSGKTVYVPVPGSGNSKMCDLCGKEHEVHCYVRDRETASLMVVGQGCAKRMGAVMTYADMTNTSPAHSRKYELLTGRYA